MCPFSARRFEFIGVEEDVVTKRRYYRPLFPQGILHSVHITDLNPFRRCDDDMSFIWPRHFPSPRLGCKLVKELIERACKLFQKLACRVAGLRPAMWAPRKRASRATNRKPLLGGAFPCFALFI